VLVWAVAVWAGLSLLAGVVAERKKADVDAASPRRRHERQTAAGLAAVGVPAAGLAAVGVPAAALVVGAIALQSFVPTVATVGSSSDDFRSVVQLTSRIERSVPPGAIALTISRPNADVYQSAAIEEGVAWRLEADGWRAGLDNDRYTGLRPLRGAPTFQFAVSRDGHLVIVRPGS
jgi:hypothetical protein